MQPSLLEQGTMLMMIGMGTVFVFLTLLVMAMTLMSAAVMRLERVRDTDPGDDEEVAAITAAIAAHRNKNKPN